MAAAAHPPAGGEAVVDGYWLRPLAPEKEAEANLAVREATYPPSQPYRFEPLNETIPICTVSGWLRTNSRAAAFAASRRLGSASVALMLSDTSTTSMTGPSTRGRLTSACGRASAIRMITRLARKRSGGMWRRTPGVLRTAGRGPLKASKPAAKACRLRCTCRYATTITGTTK